MMLFVDTASQLLPGDSQASNYSNASINSKLKHRQPGKFFRGG